MKRTRTSDGTNKSTKRQRTLARRSAKPKFDWYSLPLTGFAKSKMVRLRYAEEFTLNPDLGGIASYVFSANGMYDPNVTGTGHQPSGFDQNMAFFDHYTVIGSRIKAKFFDANGSNGIPAYFDVLLTDNGTTAGTFTNAAEMIESRLANGDRVKQIGTERGYNFYDPWVTREFNAQKFFGKKDIVGASQYRGDASANPSEQAFYEVCAASIASNNPDAMTMLVVIDYIAVLTERKDIASS